MSFLFFPELQLQVLQSDLRETQSKAYAVGTLKNVLSCWGAFRAFCSYFSFCAIPASAQTVALYIQCLSRSVLAIGTIRNHITAIRLVHKLRRSDPPDFTDLDIVLTLKGLAVDLGLEVRQAAPITPSILHSFYKLLNHKIMEDVSYWALFLCSWFLMLRSSNTTPQTRAEFHPIKHLCWSSIVLTPSVALVTITWTKTIQYTERELVIPLLAIPGSPLCPVSALWNLHRFKSKAKQGAIFVDRFGYPITYKAFLRKIKQLAAASGLNPDEYATHSFRIGGATFAYQAGVPLQLIQLQGDWQSLAILRYFQCSRG